MDISLVIKQQSGWKETSNETLKPLSYDTHTECKEHFAKMIIFKNKQTLIFVEKYIKKFNPDYEIPSGSNLKIILEEALKSLEVYQLVEMLSFSHLRELGVEFYNYNIDISNDEFLGKISQLYFNGRNKWKIDRNYPFLLTNFLENDKGYFFLFSTKGKEIKYINNEQKWVSGNTTGFVLLYLSKNSEKPFVSISGINTKEEKKKFFEFVNDKINLDIENQFIFANHHFQVFRQASDLTRVGTIERSGKTEIQNKSSRNNSSSHVNHKGNEGDPDNIGGDVKINGSKINIGFSKKGNRVILSKKDILPQTYVELMEYFINKIYFEVPKPKTLNELFQAKLLFQREIIPITEDEFNDPDETSRKRFETEHNIVLVQKCMFECEKCKRSNLLSKEDYCNPDISINCDFCGHSYSNFVDIAPSTFFLDIDDDFYNTLLGFFDFDDTRTIGRKNISFTADHDHQTYQINIFYGNFDGKDHFKANQTSNEIDIFLSPLFIPNEGCTLLYEVLSRTPKNIKLYFSLGIFEILKDNDSRKDFLNEIVRCMSPASVVQQHVTINQDNFNVSAENIGQIQSRVSGSMQVATN